MILGVLRKTPRRAEVELQAGVAQHAAARTKPKRSPKIGRSGRRSFPESDGRRRQQPLAGVPQVPLRPR